MAQKRANAGQFTRENAAKFGRKGGLASHTNRPDKKDS